MAEGTVDQLSFYDLLQIDRGATEDDIREAYRRLLTVYHPDKQAGAAAALAKEKGEEVRGKGGDQNELFLKVTKAKDILLDAQLRRDYDSTLPFDDGIPEEGEGEGSAFFNVYGPVFERNAIWSNKKPVPALGDEATPLKTVEQFYRWWLAFDSWREFPQVDKESAADAGSRDERRQVQQANKRLRLAAKTTENARIRTFVERAYKVDPRIVAAQQERKNAKERKKLEKEAEARRREEEREAKAKREQAELEKEEKAKKEAAAAAKKEKERQRKELQKTRKRLREVAAGFDPVGVEELCAALSRDALETLCDEIEKHGEDAFSDAVSVHRGESAEEARAKRAALAEKLAAEEAERARREAERSVPWTKEELTLLVKGIQRFPAGTQERWAKIQDFLGGRRTEQDVIVMAKELQRTGGVNNKIESSDPTMAPSKLVNKVKNEAQAQAQVDVWTQEEQQKLEAALRTFPKSMPPNERWTAIAGAVGKTKKQCVTRFKQLAAEAAKSK